MWFKLTREEQRPKSSRHPNAQSGLSRWPGTPRERRYEGKDEMHPDGTRLNSDVSMSWKHSVCMAITDSPSGVAQESQHRLTVLEEAYLAGDCRENEASRLVKVRRRMCELCRSSLNRLGTLQPAGCLFKSPPNSSGGKEYGIGSNRRQRTGVFVSARDRDAQPTQKSPTGTPVTTKPAQAFRCISRSRR